jgi:RecB family exonuclease
LFELSLTGDLAEIRSRAVIVPTRTAAEHLRRAFERRAFATGRPALILPHLVTRGEWRASLHEALAEARADARADAPARLSSHDREVLLGAAARAAIAEGVVPPFTLRPGILAEMMVFYDTLRRQRRSVDDFERLIGERFEKAVDSDRGAVRLLAQTRFLAEAFRGYEARVASSGGLDEHGLREALLAAPSSRFTHVVVAVADRVADPQGLWSADFDLLTRLPSLARIDVVATAASLDSGWLERLRVQLPGIDEADVPEMQPATAPALVAPAPDDGPRYSVHRDREEELRAVARRVKRADHNANADGLGRTAVVYRRPLPYVYLASQVLPSAGIPYEAFDALPLASEPYAAALDVVFECLDSDFTRAALLALLRSPHFGFSAERRPLPSDAVSSLDRVLSEARYLGDIRELQRLADSPSPSPSSSSSSSSSPSRSPSRWRAQAQPALLAALALASELDTLRRDAAPSAHLDALAAFLSSHERVPADDDPSHERFMRARSAIHQSMRGLAAAHRRHDDTPRPFAGTAAAIRRWVGQQTFGPRRGQSGLQLLDADAARFSDADTIYVVGLIQREWQGADRRTIFYPAGLLVDLGWPAEADARAAERAAFGDLVRSPAREVVVSTFTLEDDAIVEPSPFLEDLTDAGFAVVREDLPLPVRMFDDEALRLGPLRPDVVTGLAADWLAVRTNRECAALPRFHGQSFGPRVAAYKVSSLDQYLRCPFSYFAAHVLKIAEDPEDEETMGPRAQGKLVHDVLEHFFDTWQREGGAAITWENLQQARRRFAEIAEQRLATLSETDAALQRARLLGSAAAQGFGDIVFRIEAEQSTPVVERLMEYSLNGDTRIRTSDGERIVPLKATADRIDLLADGTFRVFDYKLTKAPDRSQVVQLPAYAASARQKLEGHLGRRWTPSEAAYIAFGKVPYVPLTRKPGELDGVLAAGEARLGEVVDHIQRGEFSAKPHNRRICAYCPFAHVCRKDYAIDE